MSLLLWCATGIPGVVDPFLPAIHFTLVAGIVFASSVVIYLATLNLGTAKALEEIRILMVQPSEPAQPGWRSYRVQSAVLPLPTAALAIGF